jgi:hypothetical protein
MRSEEHCRIRMSVCPSCLATSNCSEYILTSCVCLRGNLNKSLIPACLVCAGCTVVGILFCACFFRESLPAPQSSVLSMKYFSHRRTSSSASTLSDADTLVDPESPTTERLLSKFPPGAEIAALAPRSEWTFRRLMAYRPVQIMSVTMFLNS